DGTGATGGSGAAGADRPRRLPSRHRNPVDRDTKRFTSTTARAPSLAKEDESPFVGLLQVDAAYAPNRLPQSTGSPSTSPLIGALPVMAVHERPGRLKRPPPPRTRRIPSARRLAHPVP